MYEETETEEFGVNFEKVFEPNRGSKMVMAKKKNVLKQPTKAKMVEAIINLEQGLEQLYNKTVVLDDALRQYVAYKKDGDKFQKALDYIRAGGKMSVIENKYVLTPDVKKQLIELTTL